MRKHQKVYEWLEMFVSYLLGGASETLQRLAVGDAGEVSVIHFAQF